MHRASRRLLFHFYRVAACGGGSFLDRFIGSGVFFVGGMMRKSLRIGTTTRYVLGETNSSLLWNSSTIFVGKFPFYTRKTTPKQVDL